MCQSPSSIWTNFFWSTQIPPLGVSNFFMSRFKSKKSNSKVDYCQAVKMSYKDYGDQNWSKLICYSCFRFKSIDKFKHHKKTVCITPKTFKCLRCGAIAESQAEFVTHANICVKKDDLVTKIARGVARSTATKFKIGINIWLLATQLFWFYY